MAALGVAVRAQTVAPAGELRLDRNESPLGPGPRVRAVLAGAAAWAGRYPDAGAEPVRRAIAAHHALAPECVVPACGSIEALELALRELVREGERLAAAAPLFHMLPALAGRVGAQLVPVPVTAGGAPDLAALAHAGARAVLVVNPHNPTGGAVTRGALEQLAGALSPGTALIVDEAYLPYGGGEADSALPLVPRFPGLVVLRTLSKAHGLAGLRIGYAISQPALAARLARHRLEDGVGTAAQQVVAEALADRAHVERVVALNARARDALASGLTRRGLRCWPSRANFVLAEAGPQADALERRLTACRIRVHRPPDLPGALRITTGTLDDVERVLRSLEG